MLDFQCLARLFRTKLQNILHSETTAHTIAEQYDYFRSHSTINIDANTDTAAPCSFEIHPAGEYSVSGTNPWDCESTYFGSLRITQEGTGYRAQWQIGFSGDGQSGSGFCAGGMLCISFIYYDEGKRYGGKVIYKVLSDRLIGFWAEHGEENTGSEICLKKS